MPLQFLAHAVMWCHACRLQRNSRRTNFIEKEVAAYTKRPIAFPLNTGQFGDLQFNDKFKMRDAWDGYIFPCPKKNYSAVAVIPGFFGEKEAEMKEFLQKQIEAFK